VAVWACPVSRAPKLLARVQEHEDMVIEVRMPYVRRPYSMRAALQDLKVEVEVEVEVEAVRWWWSDVEV
jgi:hypothetical protein